VSFLQLANKQKVNPHKNIHFPNTRVINADFTISEINDKGVVLNRERPQMGAFSIII